MSNIQEPPDLSKLDYAANEQEVNNAIKYEDNTDLDCTGLPIKIDVSDIYKMSNEEYAVLRKQGIGASDVSIVLGVNPYTSLEEFIRQKANPTLTAEEKKVGQLDSVRKGVDLEPLIIQKFGQQTGLKMIKPPSQYVYRDEPHLKINFDGVAVLKSSYIPVEIKVVTQFGKKNYDFNKATYEEFRVFNNEPLPVPPLSMNIEDRAHYYGIPPYYYTQVQDQMLGLNAKIGYLAVLWETDWKLRYFVIQKDNDTQHRILTEGPRVWDMIENYRSIINNPNQKIEY